VHKALASSLSFPQLHSFLLQPVELRLIAVDFLKDRLKSTSELHSGAGEAQCTRSSGPENMEINTGKQSASPGALTAFYFQAAHSGALEEENQSYLKESQKTQNLSGSGGRRHYISRRYSLSPGYPACMCWRKG
jgi:hypothetical protein